MVGKTINVYTGISVYVDDQEIIPTDVNGNRVDVFYYNGTTHLPARAISKVLESQFSGKEKPRVSISGPIKATNLQYSCKSWIILREMI